MRRTARLLATTLMFAALLALAACGSKPVTIADLPVYPEATALQPGESSLADTLQSNGQQDSAVRQAMGTGGATEQRGFDLPAETTWDQVKSFYSDKLKADGWRDGLGGPAGGMASQIMEQANAGNDIFQTTLFSRDKQTLAVVRIVDPTDSSKAQLILSLSTN